MGPYLGRSDVLPLWFRPLHHAAAEHPKRRDHEEGHPPNVMRVELNEMEDLSPSERQAMTPAISRDQYTLRHVRWFTTLSIAAPGQGRLADLLTPRASSRPMVSVAGL